MTIEVVSSNFATLRKQMIRHIKDCSFVAIDTEFSSISNFFMPWDSSADKIGMRSMFDDGEARYMKIKSLVEKITIVQLGVAVFLAVPNTNRYDCYIYNITPYPSDYAQKKGRILFGAKSMQFLRSTGFDFNKVFHEGIVYRSKEQVEAMEKMWNGGDCIAADRYHHKYELWPLKTYVSLVEEWLFGEGGRRTQGTMVLDFSDIADWVGEEFVHRHLHHKFKTIWTRNVVNVQNSIGQHMDTAIEVFCVSSKDRQRLQAACKFDKERLEGLGGVINAIFDLHKPIIGHNAFTDFLLIYHKFYRSLPPTFKKFKESIHKVLPHIIDTKHIIATLRSEKKFKNILEQPGLSEIYDRLSGVKHMKEAIYTPRIRECQPVKSQPRTAGRQTSKTTDRRTTFESEVDDNNDQRDVSHAHQAGYDSYMCGYVFLRVAYLVAKDSVLKRNPTAVPCALPFVQFIESIAPYENKLNLIRANINYVNLAGSDATPFRPNPYLLQRKRKYPENISDIQIHGELTEMFSLCGDFEVRRLSTERFLVVANSVRSMQELKRYCEMNETFTLQLYNPLLHSTLGLNARRAFATAFVFWAVYKLIR